MSRNKIVTSAIGIIVITVLIKVLSFFREMLIASKFGATYISDIYFFSNGMVDFLFISIGNGLATTFIPVLTLYIEKETEEHRNSFVNKIISMTMLAAVILTFLGILLGHFIVRFFAPGFNVNKEVFKCALNVLRTTFLSLIFIGLQNVLKGVLQSHKKFAVPALTGLFFNFMLITYLLLLSDKYGITGLVAVSVLSYMIQFAVQVPGFKKLGYKYEFIVDFKDPGLREMFISMVPVIIGTSVIQINLLVDRLLSTTIGEGSLTVLNFANKLNLLVYNIFAVAISTVVYPNLSTYIAKEEIEAYKYMLIKSLNFILLIMVPASAGMMILRVPIIKILFNRGAFDQKAVQLTASALLYYSPAMIAHAAKGILNKAFYSIKDTRTPMINGAIGVSINIALNLLLVKSMGVGGLALATSISEITTVLLLCKSLNRKLGGIGIKYLVNVSSRIAFSSLIMGGLVFIINRFCNILALSIASGIVVYAISAYVMKVDECLYIFGTIKNKLCKKLMSLKLKPVGREGENR